MQTQAARLLIQRRYAHIHGAIPNLDFPHFSVDCRDGLAGAALGYRRAGEDRLFLEAYLDEPIEAAVSRCLGRAVDRMRIVEIGNMAADTAPAMVRLWARTANDLSGDTEIAVAVLTASLRAMFGRLGVRLHEIGPARAERLGEGAALWGRYYASDPVVCAGAIADGHLSLARFWRNTDQRSA